MKNLLLLALSSAAAYLIGRGRAQKVRSTTTVRVEVKADTVQAVHALRVLRYEAIQAKQASGEPLTEEERTFSYRYLRTC